MIADVVNPFLKASINLFQDYLGIKVENLPPYLNKEPNNLFEVSGIIGLAGQVKGAVVLSFSRETAISMVSIFAGSKFIALSAMVLDGVGELINILAGNAKKDLEDYRIEISLPGVITGDHYDINWPQDIPVITIPFQSEVGRFSVSISMKSGDLKKIV